MANDCATARAKSLKSEVGGGGGGEIIKFNVHRTRPDTYPDIVSLRALTACNAMDLPSIH